MLQRDRERIYNYKFKLQGSAIRKWRGKVFFFTFGAREI